MTRLFTCLVIFCLAVVAFNGQAVARASEAKAEFTPPDWILGEWANVAESNADLVENFVFSKADIQFTRGYLYHGKVQFSRAFKKHEVKETIEPDLYRIRLSAGDDVQVYEFKRCRDEKCPATSREIITYSFTKNDKIVREHSTSMTSVLFKRTRLK